MKEFDYTQVKHYKTYGFIKTVFRPRRCRPCIL